jgi:26S proteasome non-ATPase regulatory subunit 10
MIATSVGHARLVTYLLSRGCSANAANENGQQPLHYACSKNFAEIARELLRHQADPNATDRFGASPLHRAASKGHLACVQALLDADRVAARVSIADCEGNTPL